ncbi:MAG: excalibur calcium-binding domain-containing protein [Cognatishimia sp.]|uniref:excalibur calcium-binding domain-containing protein n=1 Tax=Cognatishimia sp. TaxID=2211648 RepID=UPI0040591F12
MIKQKFFFPALMGTAVFLMSERPALAQSDCHPSYKNVCLPPNGPDVDCAGGGGNGPLYVEGPVRVVGPDPYRLDRDGDGVACEKK